MAIAQATPISNVYDSAGTGLVYSYTNFFAFTQIAGCTLSCAYGDTCGGAFTGTASDVQVILPTTLWQIQASNSFIPGYSKPICL